MEDKLCSWMYYMLKLPTSFNGITTLYEVKKHTAIEIDKIDCCEVLQPEQ